MTKLPTDLSGSDLIKALQRVGFVIQRQRGSHIVLRRDTPLRV
jgi:predicted RNA binding protein YcfA (HicA-like mRNA interferase family)